jgi:hypothetical protein
MHQSVSRTFRESLDTRYGPQVKSAFKTYENPCPNWQRKRIIWISFAKPDKTLKSRHELPEDLNRTTFRKVEYIKIPYKMDSVKQESGKNTGAKERRSKNIRLH